MRFCPWYALPDAERHAPPGEGVLQLRLADGLVDYPHGKSAMVHYEHAADARAAAAALAARHAGRDLLCRHLDVEGEAVDLTAFHAKLVSEFVRRFGAPPGLPKASGPESSDEDPVRDG
jgi:hypothetical protein